MARNEYYDDDGQEAERCPAVATRSSPTTTTASTAGSAVTPSGSNAGQSLFSLTPISDDWEW